ncbi:Uncharacterised protein [uncultured archaeon]|nr:Uncharacterised protein [uncultured archaeon]
MPNELANVNRSECFNRFQVAFRRATQNIDEYYFKVSVANLSGHYFRERVYCYELYHQLRINLSGFHNFPYALQGEMDKNSHPIIHNEISAVKPDFILHKPGTMDQNLLVIEVKPLNNTSYSQLKKDLDTLTGFIDLGYYRAIHLIYGSLGRGERDIFKVIKAYDRYNSEFGGLNANRGKFLLYWHRASGQRAIKYNWERDIFDCAEEGTPQ